MPNADDVRLVRAAQACGLLNESLAAACLSELVNAERAGRTLRVAQVLLRRRLLSSVQIQALMKQLRDVSASGEDTVGEETWAGMTAHVSELGKPSGERIGTYQLVSEIARGAMGVLFEGRTQEGEKVAVKVLSGQAAQNPEVVQRFQQEAGLAAALDHPNLVRVHEAGTEQGLHYLVMDYFDGRSMAELVRGGRLAPKKALDVIATTADACAYMHSCGVVHRDIKPGNILVGTGGRVCLVDFGLAKDMLRQGAVRTQLGKLVGTPAYMSPEQARGELSGVGSWSDVYSLGAVVFRAISGRYPHAGQTFMKTVSAIANEPPPPITRDRPDAPPELEQLLLAAMAHDPGERPPADALAERIRALLAEVRLVMPPAPPSPHV